MLTDVLLELASLKEYYPKKVKNVVWLYFENDLNDLNDELKNNFIRQYLENEKFSQNLSRQNEINSLLKSVIKKNLKIKKTWLIKKKKLILSNTLKLYNLRRFMSSFF